MPAKPWPQTTASQVSSFAKSVTSAGGVIQLVSVTLWMCTSEAPAPWAVAWAESPAPALPVALLPDGAQPASPAAPAAMAATAPMPMNERREMPWFVVLLIIPNPPMCRGTDTRAADSPLLCGDSRPPLGRRAVPS